ncbi:Uncharacterised protein [Bordetella pertussis]|nr:Uncharacterised protein [Bordetella pertussis]
MERSSWRRLLSTIWRASSSWRVMALNERVSCPTSSRSGGSGSGRKSPTPTAWVPPASRSRGRTSRLDSDSATAMAANTASSRARVRVMPYSLRRPSRDSASSW